MNFLQKCVENMLTRLSIFKTNPMWTKTNPSIAQIKKHFKTKTKFSYSPTSKDEIVAIIKQIIVKHIIDNKVIGGEISLNILK